MTCLVVYSYWACSMPVIQAPDEPMRYAVPQFIFQNGFLPHGADPAIRNEVWGTSYGFSVYGSSLLATLFMHVASIFDGSQESLLLAARFTSVFFALGTVYLCFRIGTLLFEGVYAKHLFAALVGFLPQFVFLSSYFNSDAMGLFSTALVSYFLIKGVNEGWGTACCILLGISIGVCALSYYYSYGIIVTSIVVFFASTYMSGKRSRQVVSRRKRYLAKPALVLLCALVVAGWFFVRNIILYGDLIGMGASSACAEINAQFEYKPSNHVTPKSLGWNPLEMVFGDYAGIPWLSWSLKSFVGMFGPMSISLGATTYCVYALLIIVGAAGGVFALLRKREIWQNLLLLIALVLTMVIPLILSVYYSWASDYQAQGRYLMGALIPLMILVAKGWSCFFGLLAKRFAAGKGHRKLSVVHNSLDSHAISFQSVMELTFVIGWVALFFYVFITVITVCCVGGLGTL